MPDMTPVATQIQPPNGLNAFANVVNIKQGMAQANQAQQQNQELTALHQFTSQAMKDPSYHNEDGSLNVQKFQTDAMKVAPVYGQAYIGQATSNANEGVRNRQALLDLTNSQRKTIGEALGAVASDPNATESTVKDAIEKIRNINPDDKGFQRSVDGMLFHMPQVAGMPFPQASFALRTFARNAAMSVDAMNTQESAAPITMVQTKKGLQPYVSNIQSPYFGPQGEPIKQGIAPTLATKPGTGGQYVIGPGGEASPVTEGGQSGGGGQQNWWQPSPGQLAFLGSQVQGVAERAQAGIAVANTSPQAIDALDRINSILDQGTWTGTAFSGFKDLKNLAASLGIDTKNAANASELAKNIARYEAARAGQVGNTDAARALVEQGSPSYKMDATAVKAVTQQALANEKIIQAYAHLMETSPDPQTAMQRETAFRSIPHLLETFELGQMKSKEEVDAFLKRYNITGAELAKSRQMLQQLGIQ